MTAEFPLTLRGRAFSQEEISQIRQLIAACPELHRAALSRRVCELLGWHQPNGRPKDRACRDVLLRLHRAGLIQLPPPRRPWRPRPIKHIPFTFWTEPQPPTQPAPRSVGPQDFEIATGPQPRRAGREALWNEFIHRYHYLGYRTVVGPQIKYLVHHGDQVIACMAFGGAAWAVGPRDVWIGWTPAHKQARLPQVVNQVRFLILPWVQSKNLASRLLSLAAHRVVEDWPAFYGIRPLLLETFVLKDRFEGTCYRAANWIPLGFTQGRGKVDRHHHNPFPTKQVYVYPLHPRARDLLATP